MKGPQRISRLAGRINALSLRERGILLITLWGLLFVLWDLALMEPVRERQQTVRTQLEAVRERVGAMTQGMRTLAGERQHDPKQQLRARLEALRAENMTLAQEIESIRSGISTPQQSLEVLTGLLAEQSDVEVISLENLLVEPLAVSGSDPETSAHLHIHRVRLVLESNFNGVLDYLYLIESLPDGVYWESLKLTVPGWPANRVELVLYSLVPGDGWLEV